MYEKLLHRQYPYHLDEDLFDVSVFQFEFFGGEGERERERESTFSEHSASVLYTNTSAQSFALVHAIVRSTENLP